MNYHDEFTQLTKNGLLPDSNYLSSQRFTTQFPSSVEFWSHIGISCGLPLVNGLATCYYTARAVWAVMRAVGNLLILKPRYMADALDDVGSNITLGLCVGVMAPIHALTHLVELLTRLLASWLVGEEPREDLSKHGLIGKLSKEINKHPTTLPSAAYFKGTRFFAPYEDAVDLISQFFSPISITLESSFGSLVEAVKGVGAAIDLITNITICKPRHALEDVRDLGVHFSLSLGLAIMTPINAMAESLAFITRLLSTWVQACGANEQEDNYQRMTIH
ncbi:type IV secretion protein Dot [Legionella rowbothamii]|uniref:type IV secretion protein Dot n=1 Tax=Legionella rowbothamii TaxID=96229 RepID=UPI00105687F6|nr:type IV secretion protein Dot [Legionella rowbothamii]